MIRNSGRRTLVPLLLAAFIAVMTSQSTSAQDARIPVNAAELEIIEEIPLSTDIAGLLEIVEPSREGAQVKEGQELIRLVDDVAVAELESARKKAEATTEIDFAKIALEKAKIDEQVQLEANAKAASPEYRPYSESELRQSRLEVQKQEATLKKAQDEIEILKLDVKVKEAMLKQYVVTSPVDGIVTQVLRFPGQAVRQGDAILTVTDLTRLRAKLKIKIEYRDQLAIGQNVLITLNRPSSVARNPLPKTFPEDSGGGILSNAPALRNGSGTQRPNSSPSRSVETPAVQTTNATNAEQFVGEVYFISPKLEGSGSTQLVTVYANVPNRLEGGKYVLSAGTKVSAEVVVGSGS